jgi:hypothetical protein
MWIGPARKIAKAVINVIFARLEPTALPTAIPGAPSNAEIEDTKISGSVVPIETSRKPMVKVPIFKACERSTALSTTILPILYIKAKEINRAITFRYKSINIINAFI